MKKSAGHRSLIQFERQPCTSTTNQKLASTTSTALHFNIETIFLYMIIQHNDKTVSRLPYLYNGNPYTRKTLRQTPGGTFMTAKWHMNFSRILWISMIRNNVPADQTSSFKRDYVMAWALFSISHDGWGSHVIGIATVYLKACYG